MKVLLLTLIFISSLFAQNSNLNQLQLIGNPQLVDTEIVGVKDVNNRFCAGIKVISDMDGFSYQSYNGIVKVNDNPSEDMVFLSPDERVLEIYHSGYEPLKVILSEIGIKLAPKKVWQIKLSGEKKLNQIPIAIITNPAGAKVTLNGKSYGAVEKLNINEGNHQLRLQMEGYEPVIQTIIVDQQNTLFKYNLDKVKDVPIEIITNPSEAVVYLDDMKFGTSPLSEFYPSGRYPIRIEKDGYATYEDVVEITPPRTTKEYTLQPAHGSLFVTSEPDTGLEIYLNNEPKNVKTPHNFQRLKSGQYIVFARSEYLDTPPDTISVGRGTTQKLVLQTRAAYATLTIRTIQGADVYLNNRLIHELENIRLEPMIARVRVEHPKAEPVENQVALKRGDNKTIMLYPDIGRGNIQVAVVPFDANILIKGDSGESFKGKRSQVFSDIPVGNYTVYVSHQEYRPQERNVKLTAGKTEKVNVRLAPHPFEKDQQEKTIQPVKQKKSKWMYYAIPAAVAVGAGVYFGTQKKDKSTMVIDMPLDY